MRREVPPVLSEQRWRMTRAQRVHAVANSFVPFMYIMGLIAYVTAKMNEPILRIAFLSVGLLGTGVAMARTVKTLKRQEWFGATFVVSPSGITTIMPSGLRVEGMWSRLVKAAFVWGGLLLEFTGSVRIRIPRACFFWTQLVRTAASASGPDSPLSVALAQKTAAIGGIAKPIRSAAVLYLYFMLMPTAAIAGWCLYLWRMGEHKAVTDLLGRTALAWSLIWLVTYPVLRLSIRRDHRKGNEGDRE